MSNPLDYQPKADRRRSQSAAFGAVITALLALAGIEVWLTVGRAQWVRDYQLKVTGLAVLVMLIPPVRRGVVRLLDAVRHPSSRGATWTALAVSLLCGTYLLATAVHQRHQLHPELEDELVFLTQARLLSHGRLWMGQHPLADFFETPYVFTRPVYAPQSYPGTALMLAPAALLHLPYWLMPLLGASAFLGLWYRVVTELFDGAMGLLAVLLVAGVSQFRWLALTPMAHVPILLAGSLLVWAWLKWKDNERPGWGWAIGAAAGWAAITRPVDAICLALPVGVAMAAALWRLPNRARVTVAARVIAGALPFLALQAVFDVGVTGKLFETPFTRYNRQDQPLLAFGYPKYDPALRPASRLPQKQVLYDDWVLPAAREHTWANAPTQFARRAGEAIRESIAHPLLMLLLPLGLTAAFRRRRWAVWAAMPLFMILYTAFTLFLSRYALLIAPALALTVIGAVEALSRRFRDRPGVPATVVAAIAVLTVASLPEFDRWLKDDFTAAPMMARYARLPQEVQAPAIVLFHFDPKGPLSAVYQDPVYNIDAAWPDDAPIIHAEDLGPHCNVELLRYYARLQPQRRVYLCDRSDGALSYLGTVGDLAQGNTAKAGRAGAQ